MSKAEERSAARDYVLARLAACRGALATASSNLDDAMWLFVDPDSDTKAKQRTELVEAVDAAIGEAARAIQLAMPVMEDIDPAEAEPTEDGDEEDEDEDEDEEH